MKSAYFLLLISFTTIALIGCGDSGSNQLATDSASADDIAKYEADLAAANSDAGYEDAANEDAK